MPLPGQCELFTGLKRSLLYELARDGTIRTVLIRKPGALRGVRLIEAASLFRFLHSLCDEQNAGGRNSTFTPANTAEGSEQVTPATSDTGEGACSR